MMTVLLPVPGSKSVTQRALVLAALADAPTEIAGGLDCEDSRYLRRALETIGARISEHHGTGARPVWRIVPGPLRAPTEVIHCGNGGTTVRFCAALSLLLDGPLTLDGDPALRRRPIAELADALTTLGMEVRWLGTPGCPPLELCRRRPPGTQVTVAADRSSQFASALLLVASRLPAGLIVTLAGNTVSRPYLALTAEVLRAFGGIVMIRGEEFRVPPQALRCPRFEVEGDWSSAAFLLAAARIADRPVAIPNLRQDSLQADRAIVPLLARLDARPPRVFDLSDCPDLLPPLAAAAVFAEGRTELRGVAHARVKESDRVAVLADGFRRAGVAVEELPDGLAISGGIGDGDVDLDPHGDHRMAMAFGLLSLRRPGIRVRDPECVGKSYPRFWEDLARFR